MILLFSIGFVVIEWISVVNLLGWFRCDGKGICVFSDVCIFGGSLFISGVRNRLGVMV